MKPEPSDRAAVERQLGRPPRGNWRVARRCRCGLPMVVETDPLLEDGTPFPTLWWLTCRALIDAVSRLEHERWMESINAKLEEDDSFRAELAESTSDYVSRRDELGRLGAEGHPGGGPSRVKCLHAHVAHDLISGDNPVGRAVIAHLGWIEPGAPCV